VDIIIYIFLVTCILDTHVCIYVHTDTYLEKQKGRQEGFYSDVISQHKYFK